MEGTNYLYLFCGCNCICHNYPKQLTNLLIHFSKHRAIVIAVLTIAYCAVCQAITPPRLNSESWRQPSASHQHLFAVDSAGVKPDTAVTAFAARLDSAHAAQRVERIAIVGSASLDGPVARNRRLAAQRAEALKRYFLDNTSLPDSIFSLSSIGEDWDGFRRMLPQYLTPTDLAAVDSIILSTDRLDYRERMLRRHNRGRLWSILTSDILPAQRRASMTVSLLSGERMELSVADSVATAAGPDTIAEPAPEPAPVAAEDKPEPLRAGEPLHWYIKTNVPAWAMLWTNIAIELDCAPHWSVQLPVYYSGFNYFTGHRKYRTFAVVPEVRYWPQPRNQGFFAGAHLGLAYYNVAFGGGTRYQTHNGDTPALGGGLNLGYRIGLGAARLWKLEFSLGAGIYHLDYDTFDNRHNGLFTGRRKRTFYGIDNVAVSLCYTFDLAKGGRR